MPQDDFYDPAPPWKEALFLMVAFVAAAYAFYRVFIRGGL